jgi:hypothetical protein
MCLQTVQRTWRTAGSVEEVDAAGRPLQSPPRGTCAVAGHQADSEKYHGI